MEIYLDEIVNLPHEMTDNLYVLCIKIDQKWASFPEDIR